MNVYTPTDLQAGICAALRVENRVSRFVTDQDIYDAVAEVVAQPQFGSDHTLTLTRIALVLQVAKSPRFAVLVEESK